MVNMMLNDDRCCVCSKTGHIAHHCPYVQCYNCNGFGPFTQDCQEKIPPSETHHHHNWLHSQSYYDYSYRDRSQSFHHRYSQGNHLTGQGHTTDLNVAEAPATTRDIHSAPYPATTAAHHTHPPSDTLGNTLADPTLVQLQPIHDITAIFSCQSHSCYFSMDQSQSSSRHSYDISHRLYTQKAWKPHSQKAIPHRSPHQKKVTIQDSQ